MTTRELQRQLNHFTSTFLRYVAPLQVDGHKGPATCHRIRLVKYYLGYMRSERTGAKACRVTQDFLNRLEHPKRKSQYHGSSYARAVRRRKRQRRLAKPPKPKRAQVYGVGTFDGRPCAKAAIPILSWCRTSGWRGGLNSGWRSREYSQHLCYAMCGHATCPGRCAGIYTNHVYAQPDRFAVDVSDYITFARIVSRCPLRPSIYNALGAGDPVHFSPTGR